MASPSPPGRKLNPVSFYSMLQRRDHYINSLSIRVAFGWSTRPGFLKTEPMPTVLFIVCVFLFFFLRIFLYSVLEVAIVPVSKVWLVFPPFSTSSGQDKFHFCTPSGPPFLRNLPFVDKNSFTCNLAASASQHAIAWSYTRLVPMISELSIAESTLYRGKDLDTSRFHIRLSSFAPQDEGGCKEPVSYPKSFWKH